MAQVADKMQQTEFRAEAKFQRTSPQKAKLVLDMIKGQRVEHARNIMAFSTKRVAPIVFKVLESAIHNARYISDERGLDVDIDNLVVKTAIANEGPRMKRIRPAPMGRAFRYQRRMTHIIVTVAERKAAPVAKKTVDGVEAAAPAKTAGKKVVAKKTAAKKAPAKKAAAKKQTKA